MLGIVLVVLFIVMLLILLYSIVHDALSAERQEKIIVPNRQPSRTSIIVSRAESIRQMVQSTSAWYKSVIELNNAIIWNDDILDNGHSECYLYVDSKAKFDNARPLSCVEEFLIKNRDRIVRDREILRSNWDINDSYNRAFNELSSSITEQACKTLGVKYEDYVRIERELVNELRLPIIDSYNITCKVIYVSPHGRKHYEKEYYYDDFDIDDIYERIDRRSQECSTEQYRRKVERSKMTSSLRYDILSRDGFRCCLCGRSAESGIELEVDHIIPISKGGKTIYGNLQTLCRDCNRGKSTKI